jgi:hypothetical protein
VRSSTTSFSMFGAAYRSGEKDTTNPVEVLDEAATLEVYCAGNPACDPSIHTGCDPCLGVKLRCEPWVDPDCDHPCHIERTIENVSFVKIRTADLDWSSDFYGGVCPDSPREGCCPERVTRQPQGGDETACAPSTNQRIRRIEPSPRAVPSSCIPSQRADVKDHRPGTVAVSAGVDELCVNHPRFSMSQRVGHISWPPSHAPAG